MRKSGFPIAPRAPPFLSPRTQKCHSQVATFLTHPSEVCLGIFKVLSHKLENQIYEENLFIGSVSGVPL